MKTGSKPKSAVRSAAVRRRLGIREYWCTLAHDEITWPVRGYYRCRKCRMLFRVPWEEPAHVEGAPGTAARAREVARPETVAA